MRNILIAFMSLVLLAASAFWLLGYPAVGGLFSSATYIRSIDRVGGPEPIIRGLLDRLMADLALSDTLKQTLKSSVAEVIRQDAGIRLLEDLLRELRWYLSGSSSGITVELRTIKASLTDELQEQYSGPFDFSTVIDTVPDTVDLSSLLPSGRLQDPAMLYRRVTNFITLSLVVFAVSALCIFLLKKDPVSSLRLVSILIVVGATTVLIGSYAAQPRLVERLLDAVPRSVPQDVAEGLVRGGVEAVFWRIRLVDSIAIAAFAPIFVFCGKIRAKGRS